MRKFVFLCVSLLFCAVVYAQEKTEKPAKTNSGITKNSRDDMQVQTHPSIFKWRWEDQKQVAKPYMADEKSGSQSAEEKKMEERKTGKGNPIPLNQLDSSLVQRIHFDYDRSDIKADAQKAIEINTAWFKKHPEYDILLEGHCDERGTPEYNMALGERRANAVLKGMAGLGLDAKRSSIHSWGEEKPLDTRKIEKAYALNRRVEFYAVPK